VTEIRANDARGGFPFGELRSIPNQLTAFRLVLIPVLWGFALAGLPRYVGIGLAIAFVTDVADGQLARRLGQTSAFGSRFDSIADGILGPSAIAWLLLLKHDVLLDHVVVAALWFLTTYASLGIGLVRGRRFANFHLQSARTACVAQYAFLVDVFVATSYSPVLLYLAAGLGILASAETLALQLLCDDVSDHEGSLRQALRRRRAAA